MSTTWLDTLDADKVEAALAKMRASQSYSVESCLRYAGNDERFALWLRQADLQAARRLGIGIFDLADWTWRDAYDAGDSPTDALFEALQSDDLYASFMGE